MGDERRLLTVEDYEQAAKKKLDRVAYDYFVSGADSEVTLKRNRKAFRKYELWYKVLIDVSTVDISTTILGEQVSSPIIVAPTAYQKLADPEGEVASARAAAGTGSLYVLSTLATTSLEEVASASDGPRWFQLYVHKDRGFTKELIGRAKDAGYKAIVVTVDAPVLGRRLADERNDFALPEGMNMENLAGVQQDRGDSGSMLASFTAERHDASLSWEDIAWIRNTAELPVLVKGLVRPDDAERAIASGADGVVVSNHGGRQLDHAPASIDALAEVCDVVGGRTCVLVDGGFRWGTEILIALGLGASGVLIGRPVLWGLAVAGSHGAAGVMEVLKTELELAMKLCGCPSVASVDRSLVRRR